MKVEYVVRYIGKKVIVEDIDGQKHHGIITNTVDEFESTYGEDEIEIDEGVVFVGIPISEIKRITEIGE